MFHLDILNKHLYCMKIRGKLLQKTQNSFPFVPKVKIVACFISKEFLCWNIEKPFWGFWQVVWWSCALNLFLFSGNEHGEDYWRRPFIIKVWLWRGFAYEYDGVFEFFKCNQVFDFIHWKKMNFDGNRLFQNCLVMM